MKTKPTHVLFILPVLICTACTGNVQPAPDVSETVIQSILPVVQDEQPWRLDNAWQNGGLGGAVLRPSSIEHVVRQTDQAWTTTVADSGFIAVQDTTADKDDQIAVERAWRKYCHHQLDMTPEEHAIIQHSKIPDSIRPKSCNPRSLKK